MQKKVLKRSEVNINHTWDLTRLFKSEEDYEKALVEIVEFTENFVSKFKGKITNALIVNESLDEYRKFRTNLTYLGTYQLHSSVDQGNELNQNREGIYNIKVADIQSKMSFYFSELQDLDNKILESAANLSKDNELFIKQIIKDKKYRLSPEVEKALAEFSQVNNAPYKNYQIFKLVDMKFDDFEVSGVKYPNSFSMFENEWSGDVNHDIRRKAFEEFYDVLGKYENGLASNYHTHLLKEKAYANLKGFDSVIDYLLYSQDVSVDMYHRQIDLIMEHLSKPMQKFAKTLQEIYGLEKMTYADLHLAIDNDFEPKVTVEESEKYMVESLSILGDEYVSMVKKAFSERWIDFPQNLGKSTGGFCSSPYQKGSYILLNWNDQMNENFVLAHELGHAGHFHFAGQNQNILNTRTSMYFIEAPSTMNELIIGDYLKKQNDDLRFKRWVLSSLISRTYYHNFVTHLLEAAYQREVYYLIDAKKPINARVLNNLKLGVLRKFWGDAVEIPDYAGRTWMRQPHYFMGLYPYTYSAGLTVSTVAFNKIVNKEIKIDKWLDVLKAGGTKTPLELASMVDVDLSTDKPLIDTIKYISDIIDEIIEITKKL